MARLLSSVTIPLLFAVFGRMLGGVTTSGAIAGFVVAFLLYYALGPGTFLVLVVVFVITLIATRFGYARKQRLGLAEERSGRNASQVLANLAVSSTCALLYAWTHQFWASVAAIAALAEVAADTVSSECGQAWSDRAYLITTLEAVPAGTDGAISFGGTLAGILAATVITVTAVAARAIGPLAGLALVPVAIAGCFIDSLLGATLERRGTLGNNGVNFLATLSSAVITLLLTL